MRQTEEILKDFPGDVLVLHADVPLLRAETVQRLVETGGTEVPFGYQGLDGDYRHRMYGYQLLAPMLHSADSRYLLTEVGDGMLRFETDCAREHGALPWSFPIMGEDGVPIGGRTDGFDQTWEWDGVRLDWTSGTGEGDQAGFDPINLGQRHDPVQLDDGRRFAIQQLFVTVQYARPIGRFKAFGKSVDRGDLGLYVVIADLVSTGRFSQMAQAAPDNRPVP